MLDKKTSPDAGPAFKDWTYSPVPAVEQAVAEIRRKHAPILPTGLERTYHFMRKLGDPHLNLPPVFHVAGTNGKGSSLAFLQAIFEAGGLSVHKFTSPHLVRFEERIIVGGKTIDSDLLLDLISECDRAAGDEIVSFFEFFTGLSFLAYSRFGADAVLLETGLGGTHDSTNVLERNIAMLTRISFDHMRLLGDSLSEIAQNKAGIVKKGCPVIIAPQSGAGVMDVFEERIRETGAKASIAGRDWKTQADGASFTYNGSVFSGTLPAPRLLGDHQITNAGTAIAAIEQSEFRNILKQNVLAKAMQSVEWPGRMQRLEKGFLADLLPQGWELWVDGAHNDSGAEVILQQAQSWGDALPLHIITGFKRKKEPDGFFQKLVGLPATIQAVDAQIDAPMVSADELCVYLRQIGFPNACAAPNLESALRSLTFQFREPQRIIITGSLYLVGLALKQNNS